MRCEVSGVRCQVGGRRRAVFFRSTRGGGGRRLKLFDAMPAPSKTEYASKADADDNTVCAYKGFANDRAWEAARVGL